MLNSQTQGQAQGQSAISFLGYVPSLVVQHLLTLKAQKLSRKLPEKQSIRSVVMFADISGFTMLTETLSKIGTEGAEVIAFAINRYMELLVQGIGRSGGDIFKFAGGNQLNYVDAMIVIWPPPPDDSAFEKNLETLCKQSIQSALDLQIKLNNTDIFENIRLSVKIGFGVGEMNIIHVGGIFNRTEYLATGDPLVQAFSSEHCCTAGGQTIISQQVHDIISNVFECHPVEGHIDHYSVTSLKSNQNKVRMKADALIIKNNINPAKFQMIKSELQSYIPAALIPYIEINEEAWSAELRRLSVMFVNLTIDLSDAKTDVGLQKIQKIIQAVQKCIYMHEGSLNKLLMDDKGSTLIVVFGMPPLSHQNDAIRAILTAKTMRKELSKLQCSCSVGIATGTVFAGVVGTSGSRREYSVLGDSVNLAARLMQSACGETQQKILLCQETAKLSAGQINSQFLKAVQMKGKSVDTLIYVPLDDIYPPPLGFPDLKTHTYTYAFQKQLQFQHMQLFGRDEPYKKVLNMVDRVIRGVEKKGLVLIKGSHGVGKTLLIKKVLHRVQEKINGNQYSPWKYGEMPFIITQQLGPISRQYPLNGLHNVMQQIFHAYANRLERPADLSLFNMMVDCKLFNLEIQNMLLEMIGLREIQTIDNFPPGPPKMDDSEQKYQLKRIVLQFCSNFFEQVPSKFNELYEGRSPEEQAWDITKSTRKALMKYSIKNTNIIAPVVLVLDDMQYYDKLTYKLLSTFLKTYDRLVLVGIVRDNFQELTLQSKMSEKKKCQEEIAMEGISKLDGHMQSNHQLTIVLRGIERKSKDDEFAKMIRFGFNITKFQTEVVEEPIIIQQQPPEQRKREMTTINDVAVQESLNLQNNHQLLYYQNKEKLLLKDIELLFIEYIYLKTQGNPLMVLNFIQNLIEQGYILLGNKYATITAEMVELMIHEETIITNAPSCRVDMNGPIIDRLSCLEQLLLKVASSIGDIFDIQTLSKINPFKQSALMGLQKVMDDLEMRDIIETMEVQEYNIYYRFIQPFFRDCLYQRITYKQRRQLHLSVAEALQILPQVFETEELAESRKLQFHWIMSEQKWSISQIQKARDTKQSTFLKSLLFRATFGLAGQRKINQLPDQVTEKQDAVDNLSSKAMRSIILKQIQNKLTKNNNDMNTILQEGFLEKKSDSNVTWAPRYCVLDGKEFKYYYTEANALRGEIPLSTIPLKNLYNVVPLFDRDKTGSNYVFQLNSTFWFKKAKEMNDRKFLFNAKGVEDLEKWVIYLEFAKAKAVYDDFINNFGKISFPIGNQQDYYNTQFKYEVNVDKRITMGIQIDRNNKPRGSLHTRNSRVSKFTLATKNLKFNMQASQMDDMTVQSSQIMDVSIIKDRVHQFLQKGLLMLFAHIFDMSIQKQDDYRIFGQSNPAMKKLNHVFKIDKNLLNDYKKGSSTSFITDKGPAMSPSHSSDQLPRKGLQQLEPFGLHIKRLSKDSDSSSVPNSASPRSINPKELPRIQEDENEQREEQSIRLSEGTLLKQQQLRIQRVQLQKFSFGDDSFTRMQNQIKLSPIHSNSNDKQVELVQEQPIHQSINTSQDSFKDNIVQNLRRNTDQPIPLVSEPLLVKTTQVNNNYFSKPTNTPIKNKLLKNDNPKESQSEVQQVQKRSQSQLVSQQYQQQQFKQSQPQQPQQPQQPSQQSLSPKQTSKQVRLSTEIGVQTSNKHQSSKSLYQNGVNNTNTNTNTNTQINNRSFQSSSSEVSSKHDILNSNYDLNSNILQILEAMNARDSPTLQALQQRLSKKLSDESQKRDTISQYLTRGSHISQSNYMSSQQQQQTSQVQKQKLLTLTQINSNQSCLSQKTIPNSAQYTSTAYLPQQPRSPNNLAVYGTSLNTSKSLSGDLFTLRPGYQVIVNKIDKEKKLAQCTYQQMTGLFYLRDIAVLEDTKIETPLVLKPKTPSTVEIKYKQMLKERFNTSQSTSPNYRTSATPGRSKTPNPVIKRTPRI